MKIIIDDKDISVYFNYSEQQSKTACPNSNSSFNAIDNEDLNKLKANDPFNHNISEWKKYINNGTGADQEKYTLFKKYILGNEIYNGDVATISKKNSVLNKEKFAYFGDTILIGSTNETNVNNKQFFATQTAFEGKSDHLFVESHDSALSTAKNAAPSPAKNDASSTDNIAPPTNGGGAKGKKRKTEKYSKEEKKTGQIK